MLTCVYRNGIKLRYLLLCPLHVSASDQIFNNEFYLTGNLRNETYDEGGGSISVMEIYQGQVCGNTCEGDYCDIKEKSKCLEDDTCDDAL